MRSWLSPLGLVSVAAIAIGSMGWEDDRVLARRRAPERDRPAVVVASDRSAPRVDDDALRVHVADAQNLAEVLEWTTPRMGDDFVADRMFAARDVPMIGRELLDRWAEAHLRWSDVSAGGEIALGHAIHDAAPFRGLRLCVRGDYAAVDARALHDVTLVTREQGLELAHRAHVVGELPARRADVRFCGVVVGRRVVSAKERPGLILTGMLRDEPAPAPLETSVDEAVEQMFGDAADDTPTWTL